jgi:hypothetical protein
MQGDSTRELVYQEDGMALCYADSIAIDISPELYSGLSMSMAVDSGETADDCASVAESGKVHRLVTFLIYRTVERPVRRIARRIAFSGQWGY